MPAHIQKWKKGSLFLNLILHIHGCAKYTEKLVIYIVKIQLCLLLVYLSNGQCIYQDWAAFNNGC